MLPKSFLNFLSGQWPVIEDLFESSRDSFLDLTDLDRICRKHYPGTDVSDFLKRFVDNEILIDVVSYGSNYTLTDKTEQIVELLLDDQQLGVSENIKVYIEQFQKLSKMVWDAVEDNDLDDAQRALNRIARQIRKVRQTTNANHKAIENLVIKSKQKESYIPLKQRYADVIWAWDEYIVPMGEFVDVTKAFDATLDRAVERLTRSLEFLYESGAQHDIQNNIDIVKIQIDDMRDILLSTFYRSKVLLEPLYQKARLNTEVTKGVSNILDLARKEKVRIIDEHGLIEVFKREMFERPLPKDDSVIKMYYITLKGIKEKPAPPIPILSTEAHRKRRQKFDPPLNVSKILKQFEESLPVEDALQWAINKFPHYHTGRILSVMWLVTSQNQWAKHRQGVQEYHTKYHRVTGRKIRVENHE